MGDEKETRAVWQIKAGDPSRPYDDVFLKYGVALVGPGHPGRWEPGRSDADFDDSSYVRWLASEVEIGDIFVLREGVSSISAIGIVASEYQYLRQFDDVRGWSLEHARRVRWFRLPSVHDFGGPVFGGQARRFSRVWGSRGAGLRKNSLELTAK